MDYLYIFITLALIIITFILGWILLLFPIPKEKFLIKYKISSRLIGLEYVIFAFTTAYVLYIGIDKYQPEFFKFSVTFISCTQALIFTFALLSLLNPHFIKGRTIMYIVHVSVILLFLLAYHVFTRFENDPVLSSKSTISGNLANPITILRLIFIAFYFYQFLHYLIEFRKSINNYNRSIDSYYSETGKVKLHWIRFAFFSALAVGLTALVFQAMPGLLFDIILSASLIVFYIVFAVNFINYNRIFHIIEPALENNYYSEKEIQHIQKKSSWHLYKQCILEKKLYLNEGITLVEMAEKLNVSRTTLSTLINSEENQNFNQWVNQLRITEAKRLMKTSTDYSFSEIAFKTGFSEQSNFSREFKQITGETPSGWKKSNVSV